jgi:tRNA modification GTPase
MTTRVAQLTPIGRGAIATVAVEGPGALSAVAACFRPNSAIDWSALPCGRILVGIWLPPTGGDMSGGKSDGEELVVCRTDRQRVEVHCHGGQAAVSAIVRGLQQHGCVCVDWHDNPMAAGITRLQHAAQLALAHATTQRTSLILLDQYHGALELELQRLAAVLAIRNANEARQIIARLLSHAHVGVHLTSPWQVVVTGPPNVGKSSLINALVGYERSVVYGTPGTTRDVVRVATAIDGWPVELADTAGIRTTDDPLEAAGITRARQHAGQADLVLLVRDATDADMETQVPLGTEYTHVLSVFNKCDLRQSTAPMAIPSLRTSAVTRQGLPELIAAIAMRLVPHPPPRGAAVPFQIDQLQMLENVLTSVERMAWSRAIAALSAWITVP